MLTVEELEGIHKDDQEQLKHVLAVREELEQVIDESEHMLEHNEEIESFHEVIDELISRERSVFDQEIG